jgi:hypothetical protein
MPGPDQKKPKKIDMGKAIYGRGVEELMAQQSPEVRAAMEERMAKYREQRAAQKEAAQQTEAADQRRAAQLREQITAAPREYRPRAQAMLQTDFERRLAEERQQAAERRRLAEEGEAAQERAKDAEARGLWGRFKRLFQ